MLGRRAHVCALAAGLAGLLLVGPALAQDDGGDAADASPRFLYMTTEVVGSGTLFPACHGPDEVPVYGMDPAVPRGSQVAKAYTGGEYGAISCDNFFQFEATERFTVGAGTELAFWLDCEAPSPVYSPSATTLSRDVRVLLYRNDDRIGEGFGDYPITLPANLCLPDLAPWRVDVSFDVDETVVAPGDDLTAQINLFGIAAPDADFYIATQSTATPSALYGPGLPGTLRASPAADLVVDEGNRSSSAGPGNATRYPFAVENIGGEAREVTVSVAGPDAWLAEPSPAGIEVTPNGMVHAALTVAPREDVPVGAEASHTVTIASDEEEVVFEVSTTMVPGTGTPVEQVLGEDALEDLASQSADTASTGSGLLQEFGLELAATAVAAGVAFVARFFT